MLVNFAKKIAREKAAAEGKIGNLKSLFAPPKRESEAGADSSEQSSKPTKAGFSSLAAASAQAAERMKEAAEVTGKKTGQFWQKTAGSLRQGLSAGFRGAQGTASSSAAAPKDAQPKEQTEELVACSESQQTKAPPEEIVQPSTASSSTLLPEGQSSEQIVAPSSASTMMMKEQQNGAVATAEVSPAASSSAARGPAVANWESNHSTDVVGAPAQAVSNQVAGVEVDLDWLGDAETSQPTNTSDAPSTTAAKEDDLDWLGDTGPSQPTSTSAVPSTKAAVDDELDWLDDAMISPPTNTSSAPSGAGNPKTAALAPGADADFDDLWDSILDDDASPNESALKEQK